MTAYSKTEIAEKIKKRMIAFQKTNEATWTKNNPPYLKTDLAEMVMDLMAQAWDAGYDIGVRRPTVVKNPYVPEEQS